MKSLHPRTRTVFAGVAAAAVLASGLVATSGATSAQAAEAASITVDLSGSNGTPQHYGSGFIYGLTEDGQNPPSQFLTPIDFNYNRAGGAQLDSPGGWYGGTYPRHFQATLNQYDRVKSLGGKFVLLVHDLYGADGSPLNSWPGDNGDWSNYDAFLSQVISDVKANNMDVEWDLWNEPDYPIFWPTGRQSQYLELWKRSYEQVRAAFPDAVIVGPSTNSEPSESNEWWRNYLDYVKANNVVPDYVSWHEIAGAPNGNDPVTSKTVVQQMLADRSISGVQDFQVNEYGAPFEQYPAKSAWYLARLERADIHGLRSNWGSGKNLIDNAADLLYKEDGTYLPRGEWQTYAAYAAQSGTVVPVQTSSVAVDAYATRSDDDSTAQILVGNNGSLTGDVAVTATAGGPVQVGEAVRVIVQTVQEGDGRENRGAVTLSDTSMTVGADGTVVTPLSYATTRDAYLVTIKSADSVSKLDGQVALGDDITGLRGGTASPLTTTYTNHGTQTQTNVSEKLVLPEGWTADSTTTELGSVEPGQTIDTSWSVTAAQADIGARQTVEVQAGWTESGQTFASNDWQRLTVPCVMGAPCEAETGVVTGGSFATDHPGYTGTGFIAGLLGQGGSVANAIAVDEAGRYTLDFRYAAGPDGPSATSDRTMTVSVNGVESVLTFPKTPTWNDWSSAKVTVDLPAGASQVSVSYDAGNTGWVNLDNLTFYPEGDPGPGPNPQPDTTVSESETQALTGGASIATDHPGFTGTGFVAGLVSPGAAVDHSVNSQQARSVPVTLRYAAGPGGPFSDADRTVEVAVNGQNSTVTLPKTGSWDTWNTVTLPGLFDLPEGASSIKVSVTSDTTGWINLDNVTLADAVTPAPTVERIGGADRFEAAANISKTGWPNGAKTVYIASGERFPDALSAAPAAGKSDGPILLVTSTSIPASIQAELARLDPDKIVIVGGAATIGMDVEKALAKVAPVSRIGGEDRFEVSRNIAAATFPDGAPVAVLATGKTFPDALSAGAALGTYGPVILVDGSAAGLDDATLALLRDLKVQGIVIAGGTDSMSTGVEASAATVATVQRVGGADRYEASRNLGKILYAKADHVFLATGVNFPDALAGSALALKMSGPLYTVPGSCIPEETLKSITDAGASTVTLLGGAATLTQAVADLTPCK